MQQHSCIEQPRGGLQSGTLPQTSHIRRPSLLNSPLQHFYVPRCYSARCGFEFFYTPIALQSGSRRPQIPKALHVSYTGQGAPRTLKHLKEDSLREDSGTLDGCTQHSARSSYLGEMGLLFWSTDSRMWPLW